MHFPGSQEARWAFIANTPASFVRSPLLVPEKQQNIFQPSALEGEAGREVLLWCGLRIWDTAGQERFRTITSSSLAGLSGWKGNEELLEYKVYAMGYVISLLT